MKTTDRYKRWCIGNILLSFLMVGDVPALRSGARASVKKWVKKLDPRKLGRQKRTYAESSRPPLDGGGFYHPPLGTAPATSLSPLGEHKKSEGWDVPYPPDEASAKRWEKQQRAQEEGTTHQGPSNHTAGSHRRPTLEAPTTSRHPQSPPGALGRHTPDLDMQMEREPVAHPRAPQTSRGTQTSVQQHITHFESMGHVHGGGKHFDLASQARREQSLGTVHVPKNVATGRHDWKVARRPRDSYDDREPTHSMLPRISDLERADQHEEAREALAQGRPKTGDWESGPKRRYGMGRAQPLPSDAAQASLSGLSMAQYPPPPPPASARPDRDKKAAAPAPPPQSAKPKATGAAPAPPPQSAKPKATGAAPPPPPPTGPGAAGANIPPPHTLKVTQSNPLQDELKSTLEKRRNRIAVSLEKPEQELYVPPALSPHLEGVAQTMSERIPPSSTTNTKSGLSGSHDDDGWGD